MDTSLMINSIGLLLDIVGALLMYLNSQPVNHQVWIYTPEEGRALRLKAKKMNKRVKIGAFLLFAGFTLQLIASWMN